MASNDIVQARAESDTIALGTMSLSKGDAEDADRPEIHYLTGIRFHIIVAAYVLNTLPPLHSRGTQSIQRTCYVSPP